MKKILILLSFTFFALGSSQVKWMSINDAIEAQKTNPKKILIDFYAEWCGPCKVMEKNTYNHPVIAEYINANYYPVKFDIESREDVKIYGQTFDNVGNTRKKGRGPMHKFPLYMNIRAVPSIVLLDEQTNPITILQGAMTAEELEPYLPFFATNEYQKIKTKEDWENYQKKFKSNLKK